jgi:hypothetical protein
MICGLDHNVGGYGIANMGMRGDKQVSVTKTMRSMLEK